jgi:hypothetical protein
VILGQDASALGFCVNLIYKAEDKGNLRLNRWLMGKFRRFLEDLKLSKSISNRLDKGFVFSIFGYFHRIELSNSIVDK